MDRIYTALIMIQLSSSQEILTEATIFREVRIGDTITLHCSVRHNKQTVWYGQRCDEVPFIIMSGQINESSGKAATKYFKGFDHRFSTQLLQSNSTFSLKIEKINTSDLGLYYCTSDAGVPLRTGEGIKLILAEEPIPSSTTSSSSTAFTASPGPTTATAGPEAGLRVQIQCDWTLSAVLCFVCAVVGVLLSCVWFRWKRYRKGKSFEFQKHDQ
ncbi:hypothetical protein JZ751_017547 [Albula glossodonta]|uniref:Immunoglobulin domain-containing protein n=1 Tax=Albula glossodonta TaxID=121402 RepID=A0A8T2PME9_9TELE|nr:hypothetical protein JZ751_017547 [Albula glossodonta]